MKIRVNMSDLAILLDLPEGMSIESASTDDLVLVCEVEGPESQEGEFFAMYDIDDEGNVVLMDLVPN
jgi:hypothetical protein